MVVLEETTDEAADLRRLSRILAALDETPGDLPVELRIKRRSGDLIRFERGAVSAEAIERLVPRLKGLLGVLGDAREAGADDVAVASTAEADLAAVGA